MGADSDDDDDAYFEYVMELCDRLNLYTYGQLWYPADIILPIMCIIGILGNLVNIVVFMHKDMAHPINSILLWLSVSDILEIAVFGFQQGIRGEWSSIFDWTDWFADSYSSQTYTGAVLFLSSIYLLQVFHTITVSLNIALVFWRYMAIAHPFTNTKIPCDDHSVKTAVIWIYILSFVSYLPIWYADTIDDYESWSGRILVSRTYGVSFNVEPMPSSGFSFREYPLITLIVLICGVILRIAPLIILIIMNIMLIFAAMKILLNRQYLGVQDRHTFEAQRNVNQLNFMIVMIALMFIITEIPFGISGFFTLMSELFFHYCKPILNNILAVTIILNCSYSVFLYLMTCRRYRETFLKLFFNKFSSISFHSSVRTTRQTDLELHP